MTEQQYHFALIGKDIQYSRSPQIFEAFYKALGVKGRYDLIDLPKSQVADTLRQMVLDGVRGFSITVPYKEQVIEHLDDIGPVAQVVNAVNCVCVVEDRLYGYNTDIRGFSIPLQFCAGDILGRQAVILGAGGAARAAVYALYTDYDVRDFVIAARNRTRALELKQLLEKHLDRSVIEVNSPIKTKNGLPSECAIVVNCTPLAGANYADELPLPEQIDWQQTRVYYDLNYNENNRVIALARKAGLTTYDGSLMLVGQAIRSFDIWTGQSMDIRDTYRRVFGTPSVA